MKFSLIVHLVSKSLWSRRFPVFLTVLTLGLSIALLLSIEKIRSGARKSFEQTVSGTDLIVGARSGPIQLLLYSVFHLGNATNNVSWQTFQHFSKDQEVKWAVPISLGDSHRGYRVVGTTRDYFERIQVSGKRALSFERGVVFHEIFEVVLGASVAEKLNYSLGKKITLSHGMGEVSFQEHSAKPFRVVGILNATGTPIDRSLFVSLEAIEALHVDWKDGAPPLPGQAISPQEIRKMELIPSSITAFFLGLHSRIGVFQVQREINEYPQEALIGILPGVSLTELWGLLSVAENALFGMSFLVFISGLVTMLLVLMTSLQEKRREMAIFRSLGASPQLIVSLFLAEAMGMVLMGILFGIFLLTLALFLGASTFEKFGLFLEPFSFGKLELFYLISLFGMGSLVGLLPAGLAYQKALHDGLMVRN